MLCRPVRLQFILGIVPTESPLNSCMYQCHLKLLCMIKFILQPSLSTKFFFIIINYRTDKFVRKAELVHFFYRQTLDYSLSVFTMTFQKFNQTPLLPKSISILTLILIVERSLLESASLELKLCVTNIYISPANTVNIILCKHATKHHMSGHFTP